MARRRSGEEPGEEWLINALKAEADRHEPDRDRIRQRMRDQESGVIASGDPVSLEEYRFRRRADEPFRRSTRLLPAAAAAVVVLTAGAFAAVHNSNQPSGASSPVQLVGPATPGPEDVTPTTADEPTGSPSPSSVARSTGSGTSKSPPAKPSSTKTEAKRRPPIAVTATAAQSGQEVTLSSGTKDWIAVGSQSPTDTVRNREGDQEISGPHDQGNPTSTSTKGPFALSWTGGLSESSGSGSRAWRTVSGPVDGPETGLQIRVPADQQDGELVLYVGAEGANGQLRTRLSDRSEVVRTTLKAAATGRGYVVTIRFHTTEAQQSLTVDLIGGSGGSVSFAAATLR
jgi:hypothetical protein